MAVIIACRNEENYIGGCIQSLLRNDYPEDLLEIVVCDGRSADKTREVVKSFTEEYDHIRLIDNPGKTAPLGFNAGIRSTTSDVVIILSAHAEVARDFISKNIRLLEDTPEAGASGGWMESMHKDAKSKAIGKALSSSFGVGNALFRTASREGFADTVVFGAYRREVFNKTGLFDEELVRNQDDEFNYRVRKAGYRLIHSNSIRSRYFVRSSYGKLFRQYFQYGYWKVYVNRKHRTVTTIRQVVPFMFVAFLITGLALSLLWSPFLYIYLSVLLIYLFAAAVESASKGDTMKQFGMILKAFVTLHVAYGLGYLSGIFRFVLFRAKPSERSKRLTR